VSNVTFMGFSFGASIFDRSRSVLGDRLSAIDMMCCSGAPLSHDLVNAIKGQTSESLRDLAARYMPRQPEDAYHLVFKRLKIIGLRRKAVQMQRKSRALT